VYEYTRTNTIKSHNNSGVRYTTCRDFYACGPRTSSQSRLWPFAESGWISVPHMIILSCPFQLHILCSSCGGL